LLTVPTMKRAARSADRLRSCGSSAGENETFVGEEDLLRSRGVALEVLQNPTCIDLMRRFVSDHPGLWSEDIGR